MDKQTADSQRWNHFQNKFSASILGKLINSEKSQKFLQRWKNVEKSNVEPSKMEDIPDGVTEYPMNMDDYDLITYDEVRQSQIIAYLLDRESKRRNPPKSGFNKRRGTFDIPFRSMMYREWVSTQRKIHILKYRCSSDPICSFSGIMEKLLKPDMLLA